jgi:small-conductance mechanosensitive channel
LASDLFSLSAKNRVLEERVKDTDALNQRAKQMRAPLIAALKELSKQGDQIATAADTSDAAALAQQRKQIDALTAQFKQLSAAVLPLSKEGVLLGLYKSSLTSWQSTIKLRYRDELKGLLIRISILLLILAAVFGFAELWRRTIFRYVHDVRRRYQFLLLRKIVLWFSIALVIAFAFASQLGSAATFAGLLTAGVAVALQNVILSVAGYFLLIGKYGIRTGDRIQIGDVTGEVIDVGLIRMHVMELGGEALETPTGRVVAFSNAIVFQPTAGVFKQIPGTHFVWHEIRLTLSPDSNYHLVHDRLMGAVDAVFADYREEMERQHRQLQQTVSTGSPAALAPKGRLRFTGAGLEVVIRYPVDTANAAEIDDRVTRELLKAIDEEPKLSLVGGGTPAIKITPAVTNPK